MLKEITVGKGWTRFAGKGNEGAPIEPGKYYKLDVFKPSDLLKRQLSLIAATPSLESGQGRFCWLAPAEPWVRRVLTGQMFPPTELASPDWSIFPVKPEILRPWQRDFVRHAWWYAERGLRFGRVGHVSLGGGKTLAGLMLLAMGERGVVLAPRHVHETWRTEAQKFGFDQPSVSTYESAHKLLDLNPDVVVLDELHLVKCSDTVRHQHSGQLCAGAAIVVGFTGSLMGGGGPFDLRSLRVIEPGCVPSAEVSWRYLFGLDTEVVEVTAGRKAYVTKTWDTAKIGEFIKPFVTTVDTSDLLSQIPPLTERIVTLPKPRDYELVRAGGATTRNKSKLTAQLRQCTDGFVETDAGVPIPMGDRAKLDWVVNEIEHLNEPVIVYAAWRESVMQLAAKLARYEPSVLSGDSTDLEYQIGRFKSGQTRVLIANSKYSAGMNLQEVCRVMVFMSLSTSPTDLQQAIGRIYRPGQTRGCQVVYLQCEDTIDERAYELVRKHQELSQEQIEKLLDEEAQV